MYQNPGEFSRNRVGGSDLNFFMALSSRYPCDTYPCDPYPYFLQSLSIFHAQFTVLNCFSFCLPAILVKTYLSSLPLEVGFHCLAGLVVVLYSDISSSKMSVKVTVSVIDFIVTSNFYVGNNLLYEGCHATYPSNV